MPDIEPKISISPEMDLRTAFAPTAAEYRRKSKGTGILLGVAFAFWAVAFFGPKISSDSNLSTIGFMGFFVCIVVALARGLSTPKLICPSCRTDAEKDGEFCAECGSEEIEDGGVFTWRKCRSCGKKLARGKGNARRFKLRYCQRCGGFLHEEGL